MNKPRMAPGRLAGLGAALLAMGGCASPPPVDWNRTSLHDRHQYMPTLGGDDRHPLAVVTAGPDGLLLGTGNAAPAVALVMQDGQARLVSQQTLARLRDSGQPTGAMGGSPSPAPATPATPAAR